MRAIATFAAAVTTLLVLTVSSQASPPAAAPGSPPSSAQAVTAADQTAIRAVISTQLDALKKGDFDAAYAVAAPAMKALYPSVQSFSNLMRNRYRQLIGPKAVVFGTVTQTSQGPVQRLYVTGPDGLAYVANYSLQRQADMSWLIAGITLARDSTSSGI